MKPYVVSADISSLLLKWVTQNGFVSPRLNFISDLREEFSIFMKKIFPAFDFVDETELINGINDLVLRSGLVPVSLDRVYFQPKTCIDITRIVDIDGSDYGLGRRIGTSSLICQFRNIQKIGLTDVALVDDVIFSGELIERVICCLSRMKINVSLVCAGVGIAEGINRIAGLKCEVRCVRKYEDVIDEVCERDFYPGVPFSGRLLSGSENIGIPYILPFGNPGKWASIPLEWQESFSKFCIKQTIRLFEEIERCSNKIISCKDLDRYVMNIPKNETRFVDALKDL